MSVAPLSPAHVAEDAPTPTCTLEVSRPIIRDLYSERIRYIGVSRQASACARWRDGTDARCEMGGWGREAHVCGVYVCAYKNYDTGSLRHYDSVVPTAA